MDDSAPAWALALALAFIVVACLYLVAPSAHVAKQPFTAGQARPDRSPAHGVWRPAAQRAGTPALKANMTDAADPYTWPYRDAPGLPGDVGVDVGPDVRSAAPDEAVFREHGVAAVGWHTGAGDRYDQYEGAVVDRAPGLHMRSEPDHYEVNK